MDRTVRRVELPSGGWWDLLRRPRWRHIRQWALGLPRAGGESGAAEARIALADMALVSLTTAWSFPDPVCPEAMARRDDGDIVAVLEALTSEVAPLWGGQSPKELAEELFGGLVAGRVPNQFVEAHIMALTGWSWSTLQETPADVVERMALYMAVRQAREVDGALDFVEAAHG